MVGLICNIWGDPIPVALHAGETPTGDCDWVSKPFVAPGSISIPGLQISPPWSVGCPALAGLWSVDLHLSPELSFPFTFHLPPLPLRALCSEVQALLSQGVLVPVPEMEQF